MVYRARLGRRYSRYRRSSRYNKYQRILTSPGNVPELKGRQVTHINQVPQISWNEELLSYISAGSHSDGRVGTKIFNKYLTYDICLTPMTLTDLERVRVVIWYVKYPHGESQYIANYVAGLDEQDPVLLGRKNEVIILMDKLFSYGVDGNNNTIPSNPENHIKGKINLNLPTVFSGTGGDIGSIRDGAIFISYKAHRNSNPIAGSDFVRLDYNITLRYYDK